MLEEYNLEFFNIARSHFNEPMLSFAEVVRLIGYHETAIDCYLIVQHMGGEIHYHTFCGGYIFLNTLSDNEVMTISHDNGIIERWSDLDRLDRMLSLNGAPRAEKFLIEINLDDHEYLGAL